jgi:hypothetical protein
VGGEGLTGGGLRREGGRRGRSGGRRAGWGAGGGAFARDGSHLHERERLEKPVTVFDAPVWKREASAAPVELVAPSPCITQAVSWPALHRNFKDTKGLAEAPSPWVASATTCI